MSCVRSKPLSLCVYNVEASVAHWLLLKCYFTSTETVGLIGTGAQDGHLDFHTAPELCWLLVQCCFTSTETVRLVRDGEPKTATSTFTQLLSSVGYCKHDETIRLIRDGKKGGKGYGGGGVGGVDYIPIARLSPPE